MRVIAGSAKGIQLQSVPGCATRPISDRVKEALFDILGAHVAGARVLDLFAGTGGVGIEALSRGADHAVFVEKNPRAVGTIRANLDRTRFQPKARIVQADVFKYLAGRMEPFNLVYVAPPQYQGLWSKTLLSLDDRAGWLAPDGQVVVQVFPKEWEALPVHSFRIIDQRRYGSTLLAFYEILPSS